MANNYSKATIDEALYMTEEQKLLIRATGGETEPWEDLTYAFWETSWDDDRDYWLGWLADELADELRDDEMPAELEKWKKRVDGWGLEDIFRWILQNPLNKDVESIRFEGANICDKMRPGEFGGYVLLVTRDEYCWLSTRMISVTDGEIDVHEPEIIKFSDLEEES